MENVRQAVVSILTQYLNDGSVDNIMIGVLASRAVDAFREYVNYPTTWEEDAIVADMMRHKSCIGDLALYEAIQQGAEFQSMHIESGLYRMWQKKGDVYTSHGVVPFATT
jgi:hypothetical protein